MAQSRPPPLRSNSTTMVSPPPVSPRTSTDKRHHVRRRSGKEVIVTEKKTGGRPAPLSRRSTPQHLPRVSSGHNRTKHAREDEESKRDSGESFPQFCMTCEKQFVPANNTFLYCSESCRVHDTTSMLAQGRSNSTSSISPTTPYFYSPNEGPDIIPRASPTQSRPRSYFNSEPCIHAYSYQAASTYHEPTTSASAQSNSRSSTTALASLRELATALPRASYPQNHDRDSPPISRSGSAVWNYISVPFSKPGAATPNMTPQNSLNEKKYATSSSYGASSASGSRSREDLHAYGGAKSYGAGGYAPAAGGLGMDRPLPPRSGPGGYGHRPKSIDLVTPYATGQ
ncbi:hypothetical protein PVAG01_04261 [Phlyctema vagabunda]|uniref:Life-span regulatory factor domain-containing protein n=1 Tax=Phlyctema vagabunda TaxID=108571 RepID=A0ABR4PNT1_9HELO